MVGGALREALFELRASGRPRSHPAALPSIQVRAASIDINTPEFVLDGKDYAEPLTSVPIRSRAGAVAEALTGEGEGAAGVGSAEVEATRGHRIHMRDVAAYLVETLATPARAGTTAEIWTQTEEEAAEQRLALLGGDPWKLAPPIKRKPKWKQMEEAEGGA